MTQDDDEQPYDDQPHDEQPHDEQRDSGHPVDERTVVFDRRARRQLRRERRAARGGHGRARRLLQGFVRGTVATALLVAAAVSPVLAWRDGMAPVDGPVAAAVALLVVLQLVGLRVFRVHRRDWRFTTLPDVLAIAAGLTLGTALHLIAGVVVRAADVTWLAPATELPLGFVLATLVLSFNLQVLVRVVRRRLAQRRAPEEPRGGAGGTSLHRALVVGAGRVAAGVIRDAFAQLEDHVSVVGLLADDAPRGRLVAGVRVLGGIDDLGEVARETDATLLILAPDTSDPAWLRHIVGRAQQLGLLVRIRPAEPLAGVDREALVVRPLDLGDLMPRDVARMDTSGIARLVAGRSVVVTGAAGSIGSELSRQLARFQPSRLVLIDRSESGLWAIERELAEDMPLGVVEPLVVDVRDQHLVAAAFATHSPAVVFHAAALKHVPILERNVPVAVLNNVLGTASVVESCIRTGVTRLVLVSTDKAVEPTSVMGATKRIAERIVSDAAARTGRDFVSVRFGNVLGSSGSVLEVFRAQIAAGGPITITDPDMTRYFMTIPEACGLLLHAATLSQRSDVLILDMGAPRRIIDLAEDLVRLHGLEPRRDIQFTVTGRRAGEKLHEALADADEVLGPTEHPAILSVESPVRRWPERDTVLLELRDLARANDAERLRTRLLAVANERGWGAAPEVAAPQPADDLWGSELTANA